MLYSVDDGSLGVAGVGDCWAKPSTITDIEVVQLRRNVGHQRAIAIGLCYVETTTSADFIVVMDADGKTGRMTYQRC